MTNKNRSFWVGIALLALPVAAQMLLQSLLGMADVAMVGSLGATAVAAVGLAAKIHFLLLVMMIGLATGCSVLVAQYSGAQDNSGVRRTLGITLLVGSVVTIPVILLFAVNPEWWVSRITPDPEVAALTARYLQITAVALWFIQLITIYEASLRALGNTTLPLLAGACSVILNIVLNYVLIFGHLGFPALGVAGAAWGTLIARGIQLGLVIAWVYLRRHEFALSRKQLLGYSRDRSHLVRFVAFSLPLIANHAIWAVGNTAYHVLAGYAGTDALAVMGVMAPIESAFFALFIGVANACTVMTGRALGANQHEQAWRLHRVFDRLTIALVALLSVTLWWAHPWLLRLFGDLEGDTAALLGQAFLIFCALVWLKVLNMLRIIGILRAGGDNRFCLITDTVVMWLFGVPIFAFAVLVAGLPFQLLYALLFLEDALKFTPVLLRIGKRRWLRNLTVPRS